MTNVNAVKVYVNDASYSSETSEEAVDLCFEVFFALNYQNLGPAASLWRSVQKTCYHINIVREPFSAADIALNRELDLCFNKIKVEF